MGAVLRTGLTVGTPRRCPAGCRPPGGGDFRGAGASYAMRAAAGLADELSRADAATVPLALELYQKRCRGVIERGQTDSRRLARVMFVRHPRLAWARDQLPRRYPAERALGEIIRSAHQYF
jgi:2-polyprenyl-6-methoxyphenol hydroxylase-like FAD-dependent oxidoreductase